MASSPPNRRGMDPMAYPPPQPSDALAIWLLLSCLPFTPDPVLHACLT
jgi:hypothetical protein